MAGQPAVFVDRDDTLNRDCPYCRTPQEIVLLPSVAQGVRILNDAHLPVIVVTNQSGVGRGFFTEADLAAMHAKLQEDLRTAAGAKLDHIYYCIHPPEVGCPDRKPSTGLLDRAARELGVDLRRSAVIGDRVLDMELARNAGALGCMVPSERGRNELPAMRPGPDHVAGSFLEAAQWVARRLGNGAR